VTDPPEISMVDDQYWLARGRQLVDATTSGRDAAAKQLIATISWFWTVYTTAAVVGTAIADRSFDTGVALVVAAPAVFLAAAYFAATWALMPVEVSFDPRVPVEIEEATGVAATVKRRRLRTAWALSALAAAAVVVAIVATATAESA
jgi:hypothetical protein